MCPKFQQKNNKVVYAIVFILKYNIIKKIMKENVFVYIIFLFAITFYCSIYHVNAQYKLSMLKRINY